MPILQATPQIRYDRKVTRHSSWRRIVAPLAFRLPSLVVLIGLIAFPIGYAIRLSFEKYSLLLPDAAGGWIGGANWVRMATDTEFWHAILVTVVFTGVAVAIELILGLMLGLALARMRIGGRVATPFLLVPMITTPIVVGLIFNFALNPQFGYLHKLLISLHLTGTDGALAGSTSSLVVLILTDVWEWTPFIALMTLAGRRALEGTMYEAARIDGASGIQVFRYVTLPRLLPILIIALLFRVQDSLREFDKVFILTNGGPGSATTTGDLFIYRVSFKNFDLSYGATLGLVSFVIVLGVSALLFRLIRKE